MSIQSIPSNPAVHAPKHEAHPKAAEQKHTKPEEAKAPKTDSFVKGEKKEDVTGYGNIGKGLSAEEVKAINDQRISSLKSMVEKLISSQAGKAGSANYSFTSVEFNLSIEHTQVSSVQGSIYDDPMFGVDAMATKLMDMAMSLSGGDSSKADMLLEAVKKGFDMATAAWGDELPGVCQATLEEVEKRFDFWKQNGSLEGYKFEGYTMREE